MSSYKTEVRNITYNAANQQFEAVVVFHEPGEITKYPCTLSFPIDADFEDVTHGLISVAKSRRSARRAHLVSRMPAHSRPQLAHISNLARQFADTLGLNQPSRAA